MPYFDIQAHLSQLRVRLKHFSEFLDL
jgi:hypothetical protein